MRPDRGRAEEIVLVRPLLPPPGQVLAAIREVFASGVLTNDGPRVRRLEGLLSERLGIPELAVCGSGTAAIQLACSALELTGDVIVPAVGFPATTQAVLRAGGRPVAVDIEDDYLTLDPAAVRAALTPRTCAILAVHTFGCPADVDALAALARSTGLPLIFDAAPCWGVTYRGRPLLAYGDVATLSLHATKLTHAVEGGAVLSTVRPVADAVRRLRNFGIGPDGARRAGGNGRMSEVHAAIGTVVLAQADAEVARRQTVRGWYLDALREVPWLRPYQLRPGAGPQVAAFPVRLLPGAPCDASRLCAELVGWGVHARTYLGGRYRIQPDGVPGYTPVADRAAGDTVCLPFWGALTQSQVARVIEALCAAAAAVPGRRAA
jgi:dTDP-4-amino-4,6-dideoxygalactose transaminase